MVRAKIVKNNNFYFLQIPPEMGEITEVEIYKIKDGFYILSAPVEKITRQIKDRENRQLGPGIKLNNLEAELIKKLLGVRFEKRTPIEVSRILDDGEKQTLKELEKRGLVFVYKSVKYKEGVYNIIDKAYREVLEFEQRGIPYPKTPVLQKQETIAVPAPTQETKPMAQNTSTPVAPFEMTLRSKGFLTLNEKDAREMAFRISGEMKSGKIVGIKSFDGKVHFVMRNYFELIKDKIGKVLKEDMEVATVANLIKTENEGALTVLLLLAENGEILERRKGVFAPV